MSNKPINPNAKEALNQMKLEIANEVGIDIDIANGADNSSLTNGIVGGRVGGQMSKRLVELGQQVLLKQYNDRNK